MKNIKKYLIGFLIGISFISGISYGANNGSIGSLFDKIGGQWKLLGDNIADNTIDSSEIQNNSITSNDLGVNSVGSSEISQNAVGNSELANDSVNSQNIQNNSITSDDLGINSVGNSEMINDPTFSSVKANSFVYNSDKRLKYNINKLESSLLKLNNLNGYSYKWKKDGLEDTGLIAQEVEKVFPNLVVTSSNGMKSVKYGNLVAPIIEAVKGLFTKYIKQQEKINSLENRIEKLEKIIYKK